MKASRAQTTLEGAYLPAIATWVDQAEDYARLVCTIATRRHGPKQPATAPPEHVMQAHMNVAAAKAAAEVQRVRAETSIAVANVRQEVLLVEQQARASMAQRLAEAVHHRSDFQICVLFFRFILKLRILFEPDSIIPPT